MSIPYDYAHYAIDGTLKVREDFAVYTNSLRTNGTRYMTIHDKLRSSNGAYFLSINKHNGVLTVYNSDNTEAYTFSNPSKHKPKYIYLESNGILNAVDIKHQRYWYPDVKGDYKKNPYRLTMQNDGNLVIYNNDNEALWASGHVLNNRVSCTVQNC